MIILVSYHRPQDLVRDYDEQLRRGGVLARVAAPEGLELYSAVELRVRSPEGEFTLEGQLVQIFPGVGVAVTFDPAQLETLAAVVARLRDSGEAEGPDPQHEILDPASAGARSRSAVRTAAAPPPPRAAASGTGDRIQLALKGTRDERAAILRDMSSKAIHQYVLRNPGVQLDEVTAMAKNATFSPEFLNAIAERQEWASRPEIALALVRNPKTPIPVAVRLLGAVSVTDLRQIAKDGHTRAPIQQAARKKLAGTG